MNQNRKRQTKEFQDLNIPVSEDRKLDRYIRSPQQGLIDGDFKRQAIFPKHKILEVLDIEPSFPMRKIRVVLGMEPLRFWQFLTPWKERPEVDGREQEGDEQEEEH